MTLGTIVDDIIRYPLSNWKKYLILGIIFLAGVVVYITRFYGSIVITNNIIIIWFLGIIAFFLVTLTRGYTLRIIKSSVNGSSALPVFNNWIDMFVDGIKMFIVTIVYQIPAILIILVFAVLSFTSNPSTVINTLSGFGIWVLIGGSGLTVLPSWAGIWFIIALFICNYNHSNHGYGHSPYGK